MKSHKNATNPGHIPGKTRYDSQQDLYYTASEFTKLIDEGDKLHRKFANDLVATIGTKFSIVLDSTQHLTFPAAYMQSLLRMGAVKLSNGHVVIGKYRGHFTEYDEAGVLLGAALPDKYCAATDGWYSVNVLTPEGVQ